MYLNYASVILEAEKRMLQELKLMGTLDGIYGIHLKEFLIRKFGGELDKLLKM